MIKQKKGFWVFICSLVPGAGEMYMGFKKQGLSIMVLFWGILALTSSLNIGVFFAAMPIIWCYSFFNVHNLKSLTEEEFYSLKDDYAINVQHLIGDKYKFFQKYHTQISVVIIAIGVLTLWNFVPFAFGNILPQSTYYLVDFIIRAVPRILFAMGMIFAGVYLLSGRNGRRKDNQIE